MPEPRSAESPAGSRSYGNGAGQLLSGNTQGLKASQTKALEKLAARRCTAGYIITPEFARALTEASLDVQRQVGILLDRRGQVTGVVVGDAKQLLLPEIQRRGLDI